MRAHELWQHIEAFRTFNESKGLAPRTIRFYDDSLLQFDRWLMDNHGEDTDVTARRVRDFMVHRRAKGIKQNSIRTQVYVLRAFFSFLVLDEVIPEHENPMRKIKNPRVPPPEIRPLTTEQISTFLDLFDKGSLSDYRNYVACVLILDTGLRAGELLSLTVADVNLDSSSIRVNGKGNKVRTVYMGRTMRRLLADWLERRRPHIGRNDSDTLFPPIWWAGRGTRRTTIDVRHFSRIVRMKLDQLGIPRAGSSAHRLRHTFAVSFLKNGGNVFALQKLLGHTDLDMTKRYVTLLDEDLREAHAKASPLDRLGLKEET